MMGRFACSMLLLPLLLLQSAGPAVGHEIAPAPIAGFELPVPKTLASFVLQDHRGRAFDNASLAGRWTFLLFGYTHCTDVCPTTLSQIREVRRVLAARHSDVPTAWVFVTVDPARDTREALALYAAHFGDGLIAVGGATETIKGFSDQFRVRYAPRPPQSGAPQARSAGAYDIDHTASVALLGPDGKLHAIFTLPLSPERVADDVARMYATHSSPRCGTALAAARDPNCRKGSST